VTHKLFSMYLFLFITLYMFRGLRAHHQERQIVPIQPLVTVILYWWPRCVQVGRSIPRQTEVALGVPGRLRPPIFSTLGTTSLVDRQPNALAAFTLDRPTSSAAP